MSNLFDYLKSLLPKFGKDKVAELARQTQSELNSFVIPSYVESEKGLARRKFMSPKVNELTAVLRRNIATKPEENIVTIIRRCLEQISKNSQVIETHITETFEDEIVVAGITVLKVNILQIIETMSFVSRYATKFLNYLYIIEKAAISNDDKYISSQLSAGEVEWLEKRFLDFAFSLSILTKNEKELLLTISKIPDITISDNTQTITNVMGQDKIDPLGFRRLAGFNGNPIMHVRLIVAQFQANRYKEQKELHKVLSLRLLDMQNEQNKTPNARLQEQIEYSQTRIDRLSNDIRAAEESAE